MVPDHLMFQQASSVLDKEQIQHKIAHHKQIGSQATYITLRGQKKIKNKIDVYCRVGEQQPYRKCQGIRIVSKVKIKKQPKNNYLCDQSKNRKNISKKRKLSSDSEYNVKNQKKDRNVTSNLFHHIIKYLILSKGPEQFVQKLLKSSNYSLTYEQFLQRLDQLQVRLKTYVTLDQIQSLWFNQDPREQDFCTVIRILSRKFLNINGFLSVYYSNKFNKASKMVHCKGIRNLISILKKKDLQGLQFVLSSQS